MAEPAARLLDPISHTEAMFGFVEGLLIGAAVGLLIVAATIATGGAALAVVAAAGGAIATAGGGALFGEALGGTYETPTGSIVQLGSTNVLVNSRPAIRAMLDAALCSTHAPGPPKPIAQGAEMVLINGMPAARKTSLIACGAKVSSGSPDVLIGGPTATLMEVSPEVPAWMNTVASAMVLVGGIVALGAGAAAAAVASGVCGLVAFGGEVIGGMIGGALGGAIGGEVGESLGGERGRIIGEFLGGILGGFAGGAFGRRAAAGHPVDVATGELFTEELDFVIAGPLPLVWRRTWISSSTHGAASGGSLGEGWHHSLDMALMRWPDGGAFIARLADGRFAVFAPPSPGRSSVNPVECLLLETDGSTFWITDYAGVRYDFGIPDARTGVQPLAGMTDPNGNGILLERVDGRLTAITDSGGRAYVIESDGEGRIVGVDGPHPEHDAERLRLIAYTYDPDGNLATATDAGGGAFSYQYENHLLVQERRPAGLTFTFVWDDFTLGHAARCIDTWGRRPSGEGGEIYRARLDYDTVQRTTTVTTGEGAVWRYRCNTVDLVEEETNPLGKVTIREYDTAGRMTAWTAADGEVTRYVFDSLGRLIVRTSPAGTTAIGYVTTELPDRRLSTTPLDRAAQIVGPDMAVRRFEYDARGNLVRQTDATDRAVGYLRDSRGLLLAARDGEGTVWRRAWSASGELIAEGAERGSLRRYGYDCLGRLTSVQRGPDRPARLTRDAVGNLSGIIRADGAKIEVERDPEGRVVTHRDPLGRQTRLRYDGLPSPVERIAADGRTIRYTYDSDLRLTGIRNAKGEAHQLHYNPDGRLIGEIGFDGRTTFYRLDAAGRLAEALEEGRATRFFRDGAGRLVRKLFADGTSHQFAWDQAGRLTEARTADTMVAYTYDAEGRVTKEQQGDLSLVHHYDKRGRLADTVLPDGRVLSIGYGDDDKYSSVTFDTTLLVKVERDLAGREVRRQSGGIVQTQEFDPQGRLARQEGQRRGAPGAVFVRRYGYDAADQIVAIQDAARGLRHFEYDDCERLLAVDGAEPERFVVDPADNILSSGSGDLPLGVAQGNRLLVHGDRKFEYDGHGNRIREVRGYGGGVEVRYRYGPADELREVEESSRLGRKLTRFAYDALGRRVGKEHLVFGPAPANDGWTTKTTPEGAPVLAQTGMRFIWNGNVLLSESRHADQPLLTVYLHEPGTFRPLAQVYCTAGGAAVLRYHLDHVGTPQEMTDESGRVVWQVQLRAWGATARVLVAEAENHLRFQGQYHDVETGLHYNRFRYYSPREGCFIQQDPIRLAGGLNLAAYCPNPLMWIDPFGLVPLDDPGWSVYHIVDSEGQVRYVGITSQDPAARAAQHVTSGRLADGYEMKVVETDITHAQARGYEQADIGTYGTRDTSRIGEDIRPGDANRQWSYDPARTDERARAFERYREERLGELAHCG